MLTSAINRYTDRSLIRETNAGFDALYERGEDFPAFFEREIAPLDPPRVSGAPTTTAAAGTRSRSQD